MMMEEVSLEGEERLSESLLKDDSVILFQEGLEEAETAEDDLMEAAPELEDDSLRPEKAPSEALVEDLSPNKDTDTVIEAPSLEEFINEEPVVSEKEESIVVSDEQKAEVNSEDAPATTETLLSASVQKLGLVEQENSSLMAETEEQRKVIELLRQEVARREVEQSSSSSQLRSLQDTSEQKFTALQEETSKKIADLKKAFDAANRDKESMVIKYAMGEKDIMIARRGREEVEKRLKESAKDREGLQYKVKTLGSERTRLQGICESRGQETLAARKEGERWREEGRAQEAACLVAEGKLKAELEAHDQTRESLNTTFKQLCELQGSIDVVRAEADEARRAARAEEEEVKKKGAEQEAEISVKLMIDSAAATELDTVRRRQREVVQENNELSVKVQGAQQELSLTQAQLAELREVGSRQATEIVDLYAKCAELESVRLQLASETERGLAREAEVARLREERGELQAAMQGCRRKEAELLEFTQKLTDKNVSLQSEFSSVECRAGEVEEEQARLTGALFRAETGLAEVTGRLEVEASRRREETELLARKLAEKTRSGETDRQAVIDMRAELEVVKRQNVARLRELTKEVAAAKKRQELVDAGGLGVAREENGGGLSPGSRCSSSSSLHRQEDISPGSRQHISGGLEGEDSCQKQQADTQQLLVEKIVKLQRSCARRQEKLDFLEEHVEQLLAEIKKKNRIIQHYLMGQEPGALASEESDIHKAVMGAAGVGIMASLYGNRVDTGMTLELSMEINKKLQAVLEDTLLKNITLKDSLSTLGDEVSKMAMDRHRQNKH